MNKYSAFIVILLSIKSMRSLELNEDFTELKGNFIYCDTNKIMKTLNTDFNCSVQNEYYSFLKNTTIKSSLSDVTIMRKNKEIINTKGTQCFAKKITAYAHFNFFKTREYAYENIKLSDYDCIQMKKSRKCFENDMICEGDSCFFKPTAIYPEFSFFRITKKESYECLLVERQILSDDHKTNIFNSKINSCTASDGHCYLYDSTIVWDVQSILTCPYEELTYGLNYERNLNLVFSKTEEMLFILDYKTSLCNENTIYHTKSGLGLIFGPRKFEWIQGQDAAMKSRQNKRIKTNTVTSLEQLQLVIAEQDFVKYSFNRQYGSLLLRHEQHICNLYKNQLNTLRTLDNVFMDLHMLDSSSINVFINNSNIYIPQCSIVDTIYVPKENEGGLKTNRCFEDIPVNIIIQKEPYTMTRYLFLTKNGYLAHVSKPLSCREAIGKVYFIKDANVKVEVTYNYYKVSKYERNLTLNAHPRNITIADLNFKQHHELITGSDKKKEIEQHKFLKKREVRYVYRIPSSSYIPSQSQFTQYMEEYKVFFVFANVIFITILLIILENFTGIPGSIYKTINHLMKVCFCCCKCSKK